jgi:Protein of unknown function (DUF1592)/Protein of unknown function (DUF1588)/Protein of unknown function (DUF1587)/Protein of unknown function (DUF1585)/Protein of unknown function (DUF1595)/Planctomycete cytochrome C
MRTASLALSFLWMAAGLSPLLADEPAASVPAEGKPAEFARGILPFLKTHCYHCHGIKEGKNKADLSLDKYTDDLSVQQDRKTWDNVLHMLRAGEMPPPERPKPPADELQAVLKAIEGVQANFDCTKVRSVGRVTVRRLNRAEYNNTIRDLVGVDYKPAADFPDDDVGYGFDNIGDVLSTTPLLFEKYMAAAESILDRAIVVVRPEEPKQSGLNNLQVTEGAGEVRRRGGVLHSRGSLSGDNFFEEGDYVIRVEAYGQQVGDEPVKAKMRLSRRTEQDFEVKAADRDSPQTLELKTRLQTGTARISISFENPHTDEKIEDKELQKRQLFIRGVVVDGPYNPPPPQLPASHERIMAHAKELQPREAAVEIITRFATRAFRRPVKPEEVANILKIYDLAEKEGDNFEDRIRLALCRVLISPHFLFKIEIDPPGAKGGEPYKVSELELASRLSYFLWSTMPDDELFELANKGQLRANLAAQVQRMVKDPKSSALMKNFGGQWLTLRKLENVDPDGKLFPKFDDDLRAAMREETELFFEAIVREDRSILDFLDADFTFLNARLARHYGISGVYGAQFRKVNTPPNRGGILTQASILTITSNPTRTAPVKRGKWVLEQLLGTPPPPPPPMVPDLDEQKTLTGSLRQVMEQHRANAICASCHARMDPIGFAFENYDAIGAWRDKDGKFDVDASGELPDGQKFQGPSELKKILMGKKELFGRSLAEKMLTYAVGRGVEFYDKCAVDNILAALEKNDYRFSTLIVETVNSEPFQMRTATGEKP